MKAIRVHKAGGPEVLQLDEVPDPRPGPGEIVIGSRAAGINFSDTGRRRNASPEEVPFGLGSEAAGPVLAVGEGVTEFKVGDYVACQGTEFIARSTGAYAEHVVTMTDRTIKVPEGISPEAAVTYMLQALTAHALAFGAYQVKRGDKLLIQSGAGGVGLLLTQMAKLAGAFVFATVGDDAKIATAREAGADEVINYSRDDFEVRIKEATRGEGVNAIFDAVGKATFAKGINCLAPLGMMVSYGGASGPAELPRVSDLSGKYLTNVRMSQHTATREVFLSRMDQIFDWAMKGQLPVKVTTYPLARASDAHRDLEGRTSVGKLVLIP